MARPKVVAEVISPQLWHDVMTLIYQSPYGTVSIQSSLVELITRLS